MLKNLFYVLLIIVFFDFFTDPILRVYGASFVAEDRVIKIIITFIFAILFVFGIKSIPKIKTLWIPFWLIFITIFHGTIIGLFSNIPFNTFNDMSSFLALFLILVVINFNVENRKNEIYKILSLSVCILLVKVIVYQVLTPTLIGIPTWKLLVKQTPLLLIPFSVYFADLLNSKKRHIIFFITVFILVIAMARMIFLSLIFISVIHILRLRKVAAFLQVIIVFISTTACFYLYLYTQEVDQGSIFSHIYGGDVYQGGLDYRLDQLEMIMDRFVNHPLLGVGMGYFTSGYLTYGDLAKPYLLELDLLNFFSKIGILFSTLYIISYFFLYQLIKKVKDKDTKELFISMFIGMLSLLIYSLGQTLHQSYLYWIFYATFYGYLILEIRGQDKLKVTKS